MSALDSLDVTFSYCARGEDEEVGHFSGPSFLHHVQSYQNDNTRDLIEHMASH